MNKTIKVIKKGTIVKQQPAAPVAKIKLSDAVKLVGNVQKDLAASRAKDVEIRKMIFGR